MYRENSPNIDFCTPAFYFAEYLAVEPEIAPIQNALYSIDEHTNLLIECEGTIRGNATLLWRKVTEGLPNITHTFYQPQITARLSVEEICEVYSMPIVFAAFRDRRLKIRPNANGALELYQKIALVICNSVSNQSGTYQCLSSDSNSSIRPVALQVNRITFDSVAIIVVCVLLAFLVAITVIVLVRVCLKYRSIKNSPLQMWPEEPNSPLVQRPTSPVVPMNTQFASSQVEDQYEFPREKLQLGSILGWHFCTIIMLLM